MAATQKINRAALDIFILLVLSCASLRDFLESHLTLYDSVGARYCAGVRDERKENLKDGIDLRCKNCNRTVTNEADPICPDR